MSQERLEERILEYLRAPFGRNGKSSRVKSENLVMLDPLRSATEISKAVRISDRNLLRNALDGLYKKGKINVVTTLEGSYENMATEDVLYIAYEYVPCICPF